MRVDLVEVIPLSIPLKDPFETSFGRFAKREVLLVRVVGDGTETYSECPVFGPFYSYETPTTARHVILDYIVPSILGRDLKGPDDFQRAVVPIKGHPMAKAAVEMALWDLWAREKEKPLYRLLGGEAPRVPAGISLGITGSVEELFDRVQRAVEEGYRRVKIKVRPGKCLGVVDAVRERFPELPLMVDANAGFGPEQISELASLDRFGLLMIEQPFPADDFLSHAELQRRIVTPICLDEGVGCAAHVRLAARLGSARIVNIKPPRVGGLGPALEVYRACREERLGTWVGSMLETDLGRAYLLAFAALDHGFVPDLFPTEAYQVAGLLRTPIEMDRDGYLRLPSGPGIGAEVDPRAVERYRV